MLWILVPLVIFFLAKSRLPLYVLPLFPAIALLTAINLHANGFDFTKTKRYALITWLCLLVAVKWGLSVLPYENNSRPIAQHIVEQVGHAPKEILFVDIKPVWGLSLYLDSEIERVNPPAYRDNGKYETLDIELESEEAPTLIIVRADNKQQMLEWFSAAGYKNLRYWNYRDWLLVIPNSALDWQH